MVRPFAFTVIYNPLAKAREVSPRTGGGTMLCLALLIRRLHVFLLWKTLMQGCFIQGWSIECNMHHMFCDKQNLGFSIEEVDQQPLLYVR